MRVFQKRLQTNRPNISMRTVGVKSHKKAAFTTSQYLKKIKGSAKMQFYRTIFSIVFSKNVTINQNFAYNIS
jgi:hypothetical protein